MRSKLPWLSSCRCISHLIYRQAGTPAPRCRYTTACVTQKQTQGAEASATSWQRASKRLREQTDTHLNCAQGQAANFSKEKRGWLLFRGQLNEQMPFPKGHRHPLTGMLRESGCGWGTLLAAPVPQKPTGHCYPRAPPCSGLRAGTLQWLCSCRHGLCWLLYPAMLLVMFSLILTVKPAKPKGLRMGWRFENVHASVNTKRT